MRRREFIQNFLMVVSGGALGWLGLDWATVSKPGLPRANFEHPERRRPHPGDAPFSRTPIAATYGERRQMYLDWVVKQATPNDKKGVLLDLIKLEAGAINTPADNALKDALDFVNARRDPSDFTVAALVRLYYLHRDDGKLTPEQASTVRKALLDYKYGLDEPGESHAEMWTENHQILSHGSDYLAGQMFPDDKFTNDGRTGREHRDKARAQVLRWLNFHARTGPAEWDSVPYYNMDLCALLNLVEFAQDQEIQVRAAMMVDLLLFDAAVNSYCGQMGTSHGRAYQQNVLNAAGDSLLNIQTLMFGCGRLQSVDMASTMLVTGRRYTLPPVLETIGADMPDEMLNYERHSIPLTAEAAAQYGLSLSDVNDFEIWWGMGAFTQPEVINLTVDAIDKYNLWHYSDFRPLKTVSRILRPLGLLPLMSRTLGPDSNGTLLSEVNKVTYRTPDAMLSTAQDYRAGEQGTQQHIWQATLSPYAVVFVNNPGSPHLHGSPGYWTSNARLPRNAQYRNVLISIYNIERHVPPGGIDTRPYGYTHAYFPRWAFDEVIDAPAPAGGRWTFGRVGDGYVGLYSHAPCEWTKDGPEAEQELGAPGFEQVWICQVGRKATDGSFQSFVEQVSHSALEVNGLHVKYASPQHGLIQFGWSGPLVVEGDVISLRDYPRWSNPYTHIDFGSEEFHIAFQGARLDLDFQSGQRSIG